MQVFRCGSFANPARSIVVRTGAGAKPATKISGTVAKRYAAKMRTHPYHDQKRVMPRHNPICIRSGIFPNKIGVSRARIRQVANVFGPGLIDFLFRPVANEDRLSRQHDGKLGARFNT